MDDPLGATTLAHAIHSKPNLQSSMIVKNNYRFMHHRCTHVKKRRRRRPRFAAGLGRGQAATGGGGGGHPLWLVVHRAVTEDPSLAAWRASRLGAPLETAARASRHAATALAPRSRPCVVPRRPVGAITILCTCGGWRSAQGVYCMWAGGGWVTELAAWLVG